MDHEIRSLKIRVSVVRLIRKSGPPLATIFFNDLRRLQDCVVTPEAGDQRVPILRHEKCPDTGNRRRRSRVFLEFESGFPVHRGESLARAPQLTQQSFAEIPDRFGQSRIIPSGTAHCGPTGSRRINELEAMIAQGNDVIVD